MMSISTAASMPPGDSSGVNRDRHRARMSRLSQERNGRCPPYHCGTHCGDQDGKVWALFEAGSASLVQPAVALVDSAPVRPSRHSLQVVDCESISAWERA